MSVLSSLRLALARRAAYRRVRDEIAALPRETARDLGFFPEDAAAMARAAIYG